MIAKYHRSITRMASLGLVMAALSVLTALGEEYKPNPVQAMPTPGPKNLTVAIDFRGATKFTKAQLMAAIADQAKAVSDSGLTPASADDTAFFLGVFYHRNGYSQAEVTWQIAGSGLILKVKEGPLTKVGNISFSGNHFIPTATLNGYLLGATQERFSRAKPGELPFVEEDIQTGEDRVSGYYLQEGFLHAVIKPREIGYSRDKTVADVHIEIEEGTRYTFGKLTFSGDLVYYPPPKELLIQLDPFSSQPFTEDRVTNMQRAVVYFYRTHGYFQVKVTAVANPQTALKGVVPVDFHVESGNLFRFDGVKVTGLDRLNPSFLPKRFKKIKGKFYDPRRVDEQFQSLMRTGLFKKLTVTPRALPDNQVQLDLQAEEAKAKELGFGIGFDTFEGAILGLTLGDRDFRGSGRPLTSTFEYAQRFLRGDVTYTDPWFMESDYQLTLKLYALEQQFLGYTKYETGFRVELGRALTKHLDVSIFLLPRQVSITNTGIDPKVIGSSKYFVNSIGATTTLDLRDSKINPGKGLIANVTADVATSALASSLSFVRGTYRVSYYLPVTKNTLLAFGARGGLILPFGSQSEIPIDERFFNGGARSVRSFAELRLGPKDKHNYPTGGEVFTTYNAEYVFPLYGDIQGAVFGDAGSVGPKVSEGAGDLRYALGGGIRYKLPIGPLRIDYGWNPDRKPDESVGAWQITFGTAF